MSCNFVLWVVISKYAHPPGAEAWDSMQTTANALQAGDHVVWVGEYNGTRQPFAYFRRQHSAVF